MSEQSIEPEQPPSRFNLGEALEQVNQESTEWPLHHAVAAAQRLNGEFEEAQRVIAESKIDKKTGLLNEQTWREKLVSRIATAKPDDIITTEVLDLNGFKQANDKYGHHGGDKILHIFGQALRNTHTRTSDQLTHGSRDSGDHDISRLGGDEFALSSVTELQEQREPELRYGSSERAEIEAVRINAELTRLLDENEFKGAGLSVSVGISTYKIRENETLSPEEIADVLFADADIKMAQNKRGGKLELFNNLDSKEVERLKLDIATLDKVEHRVDDWLREAVQNAA